MMLLAPYVTAFSEAQVISRSCCYAITARAAWILSEALAEERRCSSGDTDDFVGCLPIEVEVELSLGAAITPVGEMLELAASH